MEAPCHWAKPSVSTLLILSKHLPAFPGISFIFLFIVPRFLYPKLGTWLHSAKHLRLTNKQTDRPKDNKACGQTWWWWTLSWGTHLITPSPLSVTKVPPGTQEKLSHHGRTRWLDSGCSICSQTQDAQFRQFMIRLFEIRHCWHTLWSISCAALRTS